MIPDFVEEDEAEGARKATWEMMKNRGLVASRKKEVRNPRLHARSKFKKVRVVCRWRTRGVWRCICAPVVSVPPSAPSTHPNTPCLTSLTATVPVQAGKKRKSAAREVVKQVPNYQGEATGIKRTVARSVKIHV